MKPLQPIPRGEDQVFVGGGSYDAASTKAETERDFTGAPPGTWVYPAVVDISNMYPGARAEYVISIHNGGDSSSEFLVYYENMTGPSGDYQLAPEIVASWISVSDTHPVIEPNGIVDVLVVLEIPKDAKLDTPKWGFLVIVSQANQEGMIKVRNSSKWLVGMKE